MIFPENHPKSITIYAVKSFQGNPRGGSHFIFNKCIEIMAEKYNVKVISPVDNLPVISGNGFSKFLKKTIIRMLIILKVNKDVNRLIYHGNNIFGDTELSSIVYIQPPAENQHQFILDILIRKFLDLINLLSRFGIDNRKLIIYNSKFTMNKFKIKKNDVMERVLLPGILKNNPLIVYKEKQDHIVITISRISREKNLEALVNILNNIDCKHFILGYCSDLNYLNHLKSLLPNSRIIPNGTEEEKTDLLKKARILIHPSINEPAGMVYMEAMSYGVIPIAHNSGGTVEIVPDEYRYNDFQEANAKIKGYLDCYDENVITKLQNMSKAFTEESFRRNLLGIMEEYFATQRLFSK